MSPSSPPHSLLRLSPLSQLQWTHPETRWRRQLDLFYHLGDKFISPFAFFLHSELRWRAAQCDGGVWCLSAGWRSPDSLPPVFGMLPHTLPLPKVSKKLEKRHWWYVSVFHCDLILFDTNIIQLRGWQCSILLSLLEGDPSACPAPGCGRALQRERQDPGLCRCVCTFEQQRDRECVFVWCHLLLFVCVSSLPRCFRTR